MYKHNRNGTYDIDVDILKIISNTNYNVVDTLLSSGTNIVKGLNAGNDLVKQYVANGIITNAIIITDGDDNKSNTEEDIRRAASILKNNNVNGEYTKLYGVGYSKDAASNKLGSSNCCTEYFYTTDADELISKFTEIVDKIDTTEDPVIRRVEVRNDNYSGYVSLDAAGLASEGITLDTNSKITFYAIDEETGEKELAKYNSLAEFESSKYYDNGYFNLKQLLIDNNVSLTATINMQVYNEV